MTPTDDELIAQRGQQVSNALPFLEYFQDLADEVDGWWTEGIPEDEVDRRILAGASELGWDRQAFVDGLPEDFPLDEVQRDALMKALRIDEWTIWCVKSIARTGKPIPFIYAVGDVVVDRSIGEDTPLVWAVATKASDPDVIASKFRKTCKEVFGEQASKNPRSGLSGLDATELLAMHRQGMSYRDIAIQTLRADTPDVVAHPWRHRALIAKRRDLVAKRIAAANKLWNERLPDTSIDE